MLIDTACSLAFYCQRCGRIQLQDVPLFSGQMHFVMECGNCGHEMGKITLRPRKGLELKTECGVCNGKNRQTISWRQLKRRTDRGDMHVPLRLRTKIIFFA